MGFEYKITFRAADREVLEQFLVRLRSLASSSHPEFQVTLEPDGFYYCDFAKSDLSNRAFRRLIDEALKHSEVVVQEI